MAFDFIVLNLTAFKLVVPVGNAKRSRLMTLIFGDGLIYFIIAFLSNLIATVSHLGIFPGATHSLFTSISDIHAGQLEPSHVDRG